ncbi:MAG: bacteriohemerythrin [Rhodocyclaceae bacterium]|nr:bacteriohemerythrin [Rhodocyclaceae bacterium]
MAMMEWNDALKVGNRAMDGDHEKLVGLINELGDAMSAGRGKDVCQAVLDELVRYTQTHFAAEEALMSAHRYADAAGHKAEHARLVQHVRDFRDKFDAGTATLSVSLLHFLMQWLTRHILESDKAFAQGVVTTPGPTAAATRDRP